MSGRADWTELQAAGTAPADAVTMDITVTIEGNGITWLDDVFIVEAS